MPVRILTVAEIFDLGMKVLDVGDERSGQTLFVGQIAAILIQDLFATCQVEQ